ncbi:mitochondrial ribosomal protein MRP51 [Stachybotrys elegans]|uniref:Mitochondrial ribosomal protein MRP51 n=1 Tax=Stachybotrys elegans TaxID=80388 RepID=A0A8K0WTX7_9HYPO|nr:mitochondrial ribosomal protein MRP51 [Stachybotrys elegans]
MGARAMSPGGALLRKSRMFSLPKPLPEPPAVNLHLSNYKSPTMTKPYPQYQSITSPLSSREKGDWGLKRPFPLKSTMTSSTPLIRVMGVDTQESVTDFASAADHTLSLEKFQEMRIAMSIPRDLSRGSIASSEEQQSVFEDEMDFTTDRPGQNNRRWKFAGPWLARLTEGEFLRYLEKSVRPRRAEFRQILKQRLADEMTTRQALAAREAGKEPVPVEPRHITDTQFSDYLRSLRHDRVTLYDLVSRLLDLAPLGQPVGMVNTILANKGPSNPDSPYGKAGPPPSHPSGGISYLRTSNVMENHPVYGPQARRTPTLARVVYPRQGATPAKLGVGGFVADAPAGDNEFNWRHGRMRASASEAQLTGVQHLDTTTSGGAKAYVEPVTASIDPSGKVLLRVRETSAEASLVAREAKGLARAYNDGSMARRMPKPQADRSPVQGGMQRMDRVAEAILGQEKPNAPEDKTQ